MASRKPFWMAGQTFSFPPFDTESRGSYLRFVLLMEDGGQGRLREPGVTRPATDRGEIYAGAGGFAPAIFRTCHSPWQAMRGGYPWPLAVVARWG